MKTSINVQYHAGFVLEALEKHVQEERLAVASSCNGKFGITGEIEYRYVFNAGKS